MTNTFSSWVSFVQAASAEASPWGSTGTITGSSLRPLTPPAALMASNTEL